MNQSVLKRMLSRGAFIFLVILGVYFLVSTLWLTILSGIWIISLVVVVLFLPLALPFRRQSLRRQTPLPQHLAQPCRELPHSPLSQRDSPCATTRP